MSGKRWDKLSDRPISIQKRASRALCSERLGLLQIDSINEEGNRRKREDEEGQHRIGRHESKEHYDGQNSGKYYKEEQKD